MLDKRIDKWKKSLLELGKRNKLINYKETKRSNINIAEPEIGRLFEDLVVKEKELSFPNAHEEILEDGEESYQKTYDGDIKSDRTIDEEQKTLRNLRNKARSFIQEQGINVLYMSFGFLEWKEVPHSDIVIKSPLVLVPVCLSVESITDPYVLKLHDDEIVLNPTLAYKLEEDFGIILPEYSNENDDIIGFFNTIEKVISNSSWKISYSTSISLLSFMKMNMYTDIENNTDRIKAHPVLKALAGDPSDIEYISEEYDGYDHDDRSKPLNVFQVVDADSSQQDAVLYSKKNISFILQGPPGTGKSQTITNIISECLADGKKVLFVSEKSAALEVVHSRLDKVDLSDFCLSLHNNKKNKKEVLDDLHDTFNLKKVNVRDESIYSLQSLESEREALNQYVKDLHIENEPIMKSIFEITGKLAALPCCKDLLFDIKNVEKISPYELNEIERVLNDFSHKLGMMKKDYHDNPWIGCNLESLTYEFRLNAKIEMKSFFELLEIVNEGLSIFNSEMGLGWSFTVDEIEEYINFLNHISSAPARIPIKWFFDDSNSIIDASNKARDYKYTLEDYHQITDNLKLKYNENFFELNGEVYHKEFKEIEKQINEFINVDSMSIEKMTSRSAFYIEKVNQLTTGLTEAINSANRVVDRYKLKAISSYNDFKYIDEFLTEAEKMPNATNMWFDIDQSKIVDELLGESVDRLEKINNVQANIDKPGLFI